MVLASLKARLTASIDDTPAELPKNAAPAAPLTVGLALGSGIARGWAHIGILRVLEREGIRPTIITGTSIGALVGGYWAAGCLDELEIFARRLTRRSVFSLMDLTLTGTAIVGGRKLRDLMSNSLNDIQIGDLQTKFVAIAAEFGSGHEVWLKRGHLATAIRASYAVPGLFEPVRVAGRWLIDGAVVNPIPVTTARGMGADLVIAVNLNNDQYARGGVISAHVGQADSIEAAPQQPSRSITSALASYFSGKAASPDTPPGIAATMMESINIVQDRIARSRLAGDPPDVMISPRLARIGLFEFHRAEEAINLGAEAAERLVPEIRSAMDALSQVSDRGIR